MTPIRIVVADDQSSFRDGLVALLSTMPQMQVVGEASHGAEAVELATRHAPDVVLMDLRMPFMDGVAATRRLQSECPATRVVVLTTFDDDASVFDALKAGAVGYLLKDAASAQLEEAVRLAAQGQSFLTPRVATRVVQSVARARRESASSSPLDVLSPRESEILAMIARGAANKDIARHLDLAEGTVKNHVSNIFSKLHVTDRLQAALLAREYGGGA